MGKTLLLKIKEAMISVFPVTLIVAVLCLTGIVPLTGSEITVFIISALLLTLGIGFFNLGADLAMTPMGEYMGTGLAKSGKVTLLLLVSFVMGVFITIAEPDLSVLALQVKDVIKSTSLIAFVGTGVGLFLVIVILKIIFNINLSKILMLFYMLIFALTSLMAVFEKQDLISLAYDSGGVTTGPITVPFIMALGVGIAAVLGGKIVTENSFGLIAVCSMGPIISVMLLGLSSKGKITYELPDYSLKTGFDEMLKIICDTAGEVAVALGLIVVFFVILQKFILKLPKKRLAKIAAGIVYTFIGLVMFLSAVSCGFMPIGYKIGAGLAGKSKVLLAAAGFVIGLVVVLAEPAVHVLNKQVEEITDGTVSRKSMMVALSVGVGISIFLSMLRIICGLDILVFLIPGYFISLALSFFVPGIYTSIAFDSGGVASGPLTSSFILPMAVGACYVLRGQQEIMRYAFGIVAMVAMTPLITIQLLGFRAVISSVIREKIAMRKLVYADDEQIIDFM